MKQEKSYIWTAEVVKNKIGKFDVWISSDGSSGCKYTNLTPEEVGNILIDDIKTISEIWNEEDKEDE